MSGPPGDGGAVAGPPPVCISRAERAVFDASSAAALDPGLRVYLTDLVRPSGLALREDLLASGAGQSYGEMAEVLIGATVPADQPVDLLMLAYAVPDVSPERATATYLSHCCPGQPMAFGICDQGSVAAFTGLRLAAEYSDCRRVLLLVAEQAAIHYDPGDGPVPERHAAVALLCDPAGPARVETVREHAGVAPSQIAALLADLAADVLVVGASLVQHIAGGTAEVHVAPAGQPCTGVWWELAGGLAGWMAAGRRVVVADYDPALRYLAVATLSGQPPHD
ncbi:MAG TPA: hypothetical protein VGI74_00800 [Streptosporangiaceae bacterium]